MNNDEADDVETMKIKMEKMSKYIAELEENLKKYTNSTRHLKYYEENKDTVKERTKKYVEKLKEENPEKLKEWRRNYYLKRKEKLKETNENIYTLEDLHLFSFKTPILYNITSTKK